MSIMTAPAPKVETKSFADESGHWYKKDGTPMYTIIGANGKERNTTLRDARKLGLVPSVTTIAQVEAKPQLTRWLIEQAVLACLTLPRVEGETLQEFMDRAQADSKVQTQNAAARGTYLHGLMEETMRDSVLPARATEEDAKYILPVAKWLWETFDGYTWNVERSVASPLGYGGKIDLTGTHPEKPPVTIDYKCKDFDDPTKKLAYDEHVTQLATYSHALGYDLRDVRCVNLFISSTVPGLFVAKEWEDIDILDGWEAFKAMLRLWQVRKDYYPAGMQNCA